MKDLEPPRQMRARMAIALAYFTGITLIVGWSLRDGAAADRHVELAMRLPATGVAGAMEAPAKPMPATGRTRSNLNCAGCGVVEVVRTIDTRDKFKVAVTKRYQIVVRFRDGTTHVFDEATPRMLRVGDRIQVIAGAAGPNG